MDNEKYTFGNFYSTKGIKEYINISMGDFETTLDEAITNGRKLTEIINRSGFEGVFYLLQEGIMIYDYDSKNQEVDIELHTLTEKNMRDLTKKLKLPFK